eukprot:10987830-Alexandrium_andersonii.AAC.1
MLRPYRGIPCSAQPDPRDMRNGETFDACVSMLYKFVGERFRTRRREHQGALAPPEAGEGCLSTPWWTPA